MLTFILGPSGSGKSRRMLAELRARAENGQRSLLIVPEQFTSSTEGTLYHILGDSLSAYVESYSFTSLAEALLRRYGGAAVETLSEAVPCWCAVRRTACWTKSSTTTASAAAPLFARKPPRPSRN